MYKSGFNISLMLVCALFGFFPITLCAQSQTTDINASACIATDELSQVIKSVNKEDLFSLRRLAVYYGACTEDSDAEFGYLKRAAAVGTASDLYNLAATIENKAGAKEAFPLYLRAAEEGNLYSERWIAHAYRDGTGTEKSPDAATNWFELASRRGDPLAMVDFANFLLNDSRQNNLEKAVALLLLVDRNFKFGLKPATKQYAEDQEKHFTQGQRQLVEALMDDYSSDWSRLHQ